MAIQASRNRYAAPRPRQTSLETEYPAIAATMTESPTPPTVTITELTR